LQVKLCDPRLSALSVPWCKKALYKYSSFPFLFPFMHAWWGCRWHCPQQQMDSHGSQWFLDSGDGPMLLFDFAWERSWWTAAWLPAKWNWLLKSFARQDSPGVAKKNRCLALGLLEIPVRPAWTFMSLLSCSHAWSAPTDTKGMVLLLQRCCPRPVLSMCLDDRSWVHAYLLCSVARVACIWAYPWQRSWFCRFYESWHHITQPTVGVP